MSLLAVVLLLPFFAIFFIKSVELELAPDDAKQNATTYINSGVAFSLVDRFFFLGNRVEIEFSAPGFHSNILTLQTPLVDGKYEVTLTPIDGILTVTVKAPDPWEFRLDASDTVYTESPIEVSLPAGRVGLSLMGKWFKHVEGSVDLRGRGEKQIVALLAEPVIGRVSYEILPHDSKAYLNGDYIMANMDFVEVSLGEHRMDFRRDGYFPQSVEFSIEDTVDIDLGKITLEAAPVAFTLTSAPTQASVFVGDDYVGVTPYIADVAVDRRHMITLRKRGFSDKTITIAPKPGVEVKRFVDLSGKRVRATFTANVDAEIFVNEQSIGRAPQEIEIGLGDRVSASAASYVEMNTNIPSWADGTFQFHFDLISEIDYPFLNAPPTIELGQGMRLKKFPGGIVPTFLFGALDRPRAPLADVKVPPFYLATTEVSVQYYHHIMGLKPESKEESALPMTGLSWKQAAMLANAVSKAQGLDAFYQFFSDRGTQVVRFDISSHGYRLPTEAEWLYVAKQAVSPIGQVANMAYWGAQEEIPRGQGNFSGRESKDISGREIYPGYVDNHIYVAPVGSYRANRLNIHDLDGNVTEWLHNYSERQQGTRFSIFGPNQGLRYLVKGASYLTSSREELEIRYVRAELGRAPKVGMRLAKTL